MTRQCWAACLGDCEGPLTGEHTISEAVLAQFADAKKTITVKGLPYCLDAPKKVAVGGVKTNNLCDRHNGLLSPVDDAGAKFFGLLEATRTDHDRLTGATVLPAWATVRTLSGPPIERWFLKTLINTAWHGDYPIGALGGAPGMPTPELVEIAFGRRAFTGRAGLCFALGVGDKIGEEAVTIITVTHTDGYVAVGLFILRGFRFALCLLPEGLPDGIGAVIGEGWERMSLVQPPRVLEFAHGRVVTHQIKLAWPGDLLKPPRRRRR